MSAQGKNIHITFFFHSFAKVSMFCRTHYLLFHLVIVDFEDYTGRQVLIMQPMLNTYCGQYYTGCLVFNLPGPFMVPTLGYENVEIWVKFVKI